MFRTREIANRYKRYALLSLKILLVSLTIVLFFIVAGWPVLSLISILLVSPILPVLLYFSRRYLSWNRGAEGEERVATVLDSLPEPYVALHDVVLPIERGNIDHVVLGPNGVFAVETKNVRGHFLEEKDEWSWVGGLWGVTRSTSSFSRQAKWNAGNLRSFISGRFKKEVFVHAILCFADPNVELSISSPTVAIARLKGLKKAITNFKSDYRLRGVEIQALTKAIGEYSRIS